jgi:hypothetical protein
MSIISVLGSLVYWAVGLLNAPPPAGLDLARPWVRRCLRMRKTRVIIRAKVSEKDRASHEKGICLPRISVMMILS